MSTSSDQHLKCGGTGLCLSRNSRAAPLCRHSGSTIYYQGRPLITPTDGSTPYFATPGTSPTIKPTPITPAPPATQPNGPPITPNEPYTIFGGPGYCQVTTKASYLTCSNLTASGNSSQEHFIPTSPDGSLNNIQPGQPVLWQSAATGRYCRLVSQASGAEYIRCDQTSAATATVFIYEGREGFSYNNRPLIVPQNGTPAYIPPYPQPPPRPVPVDPGVPSTMVPTTCSGQQVVIATTAPGGPSTATSASGITSLGLQLTGKELSVVMFSTAHTKTTAAGPVSSAAHTNTTVVGPVPSSRCQKPYDLVLLPDGNIVLQDREGRVMWSSQTACLGLCKCYTYAVADLPALQLRCAGSNQVVWSTNVHSTANALQRTANQLSSKAVLSLSPDASQCIGTASGPSALFSYSGRYMLRPAATGSLTLTDTATSQLIWSPVVLGARSTSSTRPYQLCLDTKGQLLLQSLAQGAAVAWHAAMAGASAASSSSYYTALINEATGSMVVVTSACQKVFDSSAAEQQESPLGSDVSGARPPTRRSPPWPATSARRPPPPPPRRSPPPARQPPFPKVTRGGVAKVPAAAFRRPPPPKGPNAAPAWVTERPGSPVPPAERASLHPPGNSGSSARLVQILSRAQPSPAADTSLAMPPSPLEAARQAGPLGPPAAACSPGASQLEDAGLCGGITLCGVDAACASLACCSPGLACTRSSEFVWVCARRL
jgi:hypothetical protein